MEFKSWRTTLLMSLCLFVALGLQADSDDLSTIVTQTPKPPTAKDLLKDKVVAARKKLQKDPKNASAWFDLARSSESLSESSLFHGQRAAWRETALAALDHAQNLSPKAEAFGKLEKDIARANQKQKLAVDFDVLQIGGGQGRYCMQVFPFKFLEPKTGWALTIHSLDMQMLWDSAQWGNPYDKSIRLLLEPLALELDRRLWQWEFHPALDFWPPYFGHGISLEAFATACPWAFAQGWTNSDVGPVPPEQGSSTVQYLGQFVPAQYYEAGLRLDWRFFSASGGYSWMLASSQATPEYDFPSEQLIGFFIKGELKID